jgi:hypothetical protein
MVIGLIKTKAVLPVGLRRDAKVNVRLLTPEQVGRDRYKALPGQLVAGLANVCADPEQFLAERPRREPAKPSAVRYKRQMHRLVLLWAIRSVMVFSSDDGFYSGRIRHGSHTLG